MSIKLNKVHLAIAVICFIITSFVGDAYRAWAWGNGVNDYGLADAWTNIWGMPTALFLWSGVGWVQERSSRSNAIIGAILGFVAYELLQALLPRGTCDAKDMVGSVVGALITLLMFAASDWFVRKAVSDNQNGTA